MTRPILSSNKPVSGDMIPKDTYINQSDGLLYCSRCHTPRQTVQTLCGKEQTFFCLCRCETEKRDHLIQQMKTRELRMKAQQLRSLGLRDAAYRSYTFEADLDLNKDKMPIARNFVNSWEDMHSKGLGLLIWGPVGSGKTFIAGCIANALLDQGIRVVMTNFAEITNVLTGQFSEERDAYLKMLADCSLLIIDDLGVERCTTYMKEQMFNIIDHQYRNNRPLIVTTNQTLEELKHPPDLTMERIYSRILAKSVPLKIDRSDIRADEAQEARSYARSLLT